MLLECSGSFPAVPDAAVHFLLYLSLGHLIELLRLVTASDPSPGSAIDPGPPLRATPEPQGKSAKMLVEHSIRILSLGCGYGT